MDRNSSLNKALSLMLRPVVRFCLKHSTTIRDLNAILKVLYVEIAAEEMEAQGLKVNVNRISLSSGVHRKDVSTIYRDRQEPERARQSFHARIIGQWSHDPRFTTKAGKPRVLSEEDFKKMVGAVSRHLHVATIRQELERVGLLEHSAQGVRLVSDLDLNLGDEKRRLSLLSRNMETLLEASEANLDIEDEIGHLHVRTEYDNIFIEDVPEIKEWLIKEGKAFHRRARNFLSKFDHDVQPDPGKTPGARVALCACSFTSDNSSENQEDS